MSESRSHDAIAQSLAAPLVGAMAERAAATDLTGAFPSEDFAALRAAGLFGLMVPTSLGGLGATFSQYAAVAFTLATGNGASALIFNMHASVTGALALTPDALARAVGADDAWFTARDGYLRDAVGGMHFAVAMSERGPGSRLSALRSTYEVTKEGIKLRAEKAFVSGAAAADRYLVAARDANDDQRVSYLIVPAGPGVLVTETWDSLGMRATASHDVSFDCVLDHSALVGGVEGIALMIAALMPQWLVASYAAVYAGVARAAVNAAVEELRRRGLTKLSAVRARVGRADAQARAAELAVYDAAALVDVAPGSLEANRAVYRAKLIAGDSAVEVATSMLEAAGASATRRGNVLERLYRDARCGALQPATSDVCADWLGVSALGGDPDHVEVPRW